MATPLLFLLLNSLVLLLVYPNLSVCTLVTGVRARVSLLLEAFFVTAFFNLSA
jgi:hypothetical protein